MYLIIVIKLISSKKKRSFNIIKLIVTRVTLVIISRIKRERGGLTDQ